MATAPKEKGYLLKEALWFDLKIKEEKNMTEMDGCLESERFFAFNSPLRQLGHSAPFHSFE